MNPVRNIHDKTPIERRYFELAAQTNPNARTPLRTVALALQLWEQRPDLTIPQIAQAAAVHPRRVSEWASAAGMPSRCGMRNDRVVAAFELHGSVAKAAAAAGVSRHTVRRALARAGVSPPDRNESVSDALADRFAPPPGFVGTHEAGRVLNVAPETVRTWCATGRVPGAHRGTVGKRVRWLVPEQWLNQQARTYQPRRGRKTFDGQDRTQLPAEPFARWLRDHPKSLDELAQDAGMPDGRRLRAMLRGSQRMVGLSFADRVLVAQDTRLEDLWPFELLHDDRGEAAA